MPAQSLGGAYRGRVCVCAFIGMSVCACIRALVSVLMLNKHTHISSFECSHKTGKEAAGLMGRHTCMSWIRKRSSSIPSSAQPTHTTHMQAMNPKKLA